MRIRSSVWMFGVLCASVAALAPSEAMAKNAAASPGLLDDGRLEVTWFGSGIEFRRPDDIDYLWVKPGFSLDGQKLSFATWPEPQFLGEGAEKRDVKDKRLANQMNSAMPETFAEAFRNAFGSRLKVVDKGATVRVTGRLVDCSTGSAAAKFWVGLGAGAGSTTFDVKFVDAKSGALLAALHHRVVSGTSISTTDSKFVKWVDETVAAFAKKGIEKLYQSGKKVKD